MRSCECMTLQIILSNYVLFRVMTLDATTYQLLMKWASSYLEKTFSKATIVILSFIFDHSTITIHATIGIIYSSTTSVRDMQHMLPYTTSFSFPSGNLGGIMNCVFRIIPGG